MWRGVGAAAPPSPFPVLNVTAPRTIAAHNFLWKGNRASCVLPSFRTSIQESFLAFLKEPRPGKARTLEKGPPVVRRKSVTQDFGPYPLAEVIRVKHIFDSFDSDMSGTVLLKEFVNCAAWRQMYPPVRSVLLQCGSRRAGCAAPAPLPTHTSTHVLPC